MYKRRFSSYINPVLLFVILHKLCLTLFMGGGGAGPINQLGLLSAARVANPDPIFFGGGIRIRFFFIRIRFFLDPDPPLLEPDPIF